MFFVSWITYNIYILSKFIISFLTSLIAGFVVFLAPSKECVASALIRITAAAGWVAATGTGLDCVKRQPNTIL